MLTASPLHPGSVARYLEKCVPAGCVEPTCHELTCAHATWASRWEPVLTALRGGRAPALSKVCERALGLWLVRTVHMETAEKLPPGNLIDGDLFPDPESLLEHLLDRLIPAVLGQRRQPSMRAVQRGSVLPPVEPWTARQVRAWLGELAALLELDEARDLEWWTLRHRLATRRSRLRWLGPLLGGLIGAALGTLLGAYVIDASVRELLLAAGWSPDAAGAVSQALLVPLLVLGPVLGIGAGAVAAARRQTPLWSARWLLGALGGLAGAIPIARTLALPLAGSIGVLVLNAGGSPAAIQTMFEWLLGAVPAVGLVIGVIVGVRCASRWREPEPARADVGIKGRKASLVLALMPGLTGGTILGGLLAFSTAQADGAPLWFNIVAGILLTIPVALAVASLYGVSYGISAWSRQSTVSAPAATPWSTLEHDRAFTLLNATLWLVFSAIILLIFSVVGTVHTVLTTSLTAGGLLGGLVCLLAGTAWPGYVVAVSREALVRRLPRRLSLFLGDMRRLGLLRLAGSAYQFRHAEFQDYLARSTRRPPHATSASRQPSRT